MNREIKYLIGGILVGGVLVWFAIQGIVRTNNSGMMGMMGFNNSERQLAARPSVIDAHFIEQMIPHHEDAIEMSKIALTKATRQEVKTLAQQIIDSQTLEIDQMKNWYKEWFGRELPTGDGVMRQHGMMGNKGFHMGIRGDESDIEILTNAADFDREFLEQMIPHHQMAVMMASMLKNGTQRSEMKQLADDIIAAQTDEIDQMREWLKEW